MASDAGTCIRWCGGVGGRRRRRLAGSAGGAGSDRRGDAAAHRETTSCAAIWPGAACARAASFTWQKCAQQTAAIYERVLAGPTTTPAGSKNHEERTCASC